MILTIWHHQDILKFTIKNDYYLEDRSQFDVSYISITLIKKAACNKSFIFWSVGILCL